MGIAERYRSRGGSTKPDSGMRHQTALLERRWVPDVLDVAQIKKVGCEIGFAMGLAAHGIGKFGAGDSLIE